MSAITVPSMRRDSEISPERHCLGQWTAERIQTIVAQLPQEYRSVTTMALSEKRNYEEIANLLDIPLGIVRSRLHRARGLIRRNIPE